MKALVQNDPQRYALHVQYYGGFDAQRLCPAAVLEDHQTGALCAVYPASNRVIATCEAFGTVIMS